MVSGVRQHGSTLSKPLLLDPTGDPRRNPMSASPPFLLRNVSCRIFPLKANVAVLQNFCDKYLNMDIPPEIVHYAPALPYVYLIAMNYGSLTSDAVQAQNQGWFAQHEVAFSVPLQRWRRVKDRLVFQDWASVSPFIYVDDQYSLYTGREVYGWNKVTCRMDSDVSGWVSDPRARVKQLAMSIVDFDNGYAGEAESARTLLRIDADPPPTLAEFPLDPFNPWLPWWAAPNALANATALAGSALDMALASRSRGYESHRSLAGLAEMAAAVGGKLRAVLPDLLPRPGLRGTAIDQTMANLPSLFADMVTLKQFRNPEEPTLACYQALVNGRMGVDRFNRGGLLGDMALLRGEASGGYRVRIDRLATQPIIQTLGLEVASWADTDDDGAGAAAILKPVLPLWLDLDLYYGKGEAICSRAFGGASDHIGASGDWVDEQNPPVRPRKPAGPAAAGKAPGLPYYNTTLGGATQAIAGPFHFPDVTVQVYPLLADPGRIKAFLNNYLNDPLNQMRPFGGAAGTTAWRFEAMGAYVYMTVKVFGNELGDMWSGSNNIGSFFDREVSFCVPVRWYDAQSGLVSIALIEAVKYSSSSRAVATDREVNGFNAIKATIQSPADAWLEPSGPIRKRSYLNVATEVTPALNAGEKSQQRTLLEIDEREILRDGDAAAWRGVADTWGRAAIAELKRKTYKAAEQRACVDQVKALALELLANGQPVNRLAVKQYRDGEDTARACYQALVHDTLTVTSVYDLREIDRPLHLRLHRQPGHLLADLFGLKVKRQESVGGEVIDIIQPLRPFWMRLGLKEDLATVACFRATDGPWQIVHPWFDPAGPAKAAAAAAAAPASGRGEPQTAARRMEGQVPYFRRGRERASVGPWLATNGRLGLPTPNLPPAFQPADGAPHTFDGGNLRLRLKSRLADWLRAALVAELMWKGMIFRRQASEAQAAVLKTIAASGDAGDAETLLRGSNITPLCESLSNDRLNRYTVLIDAAFKANLHSNADFENFVRLSSLLIQILGPSAVSGHAPPLFNDHLTAISAWLSEIIPDQDTSPTKLFEFFGHDKVAELTLRLQTVSRVRDVYGTLPHYVQEIIFANMTLGQRQALDALSAYEAPSLEGAADADTPQMLSRLGSQITLIDPLFKWLEEAASVWIEWWRWYRLRYDDARTAIESIDEIQLVLDNILSSEWENNRSRPRLANTPVPMTAGGAQGLLEALRPNEFIPAGPDVAELAVQEGLMLWINPLTLLESQMWVAPLRQTADGEAGHSAEILSS